MKLIYPKMFKMNYSVLFQDIEYWWGAGTSSIYREFIDRENGGELIEINPASKIEALKIKLTSKTYKLCDGTKIRHGIINK